MLDCNNYTDANKHGDDISKSQIFHVIIAICTFKRPSLLRKTLQSLAELRYPEGIKTEILIVDNDINESAKNVVEECKHKIVVNINYVVEKEKGLSTVRNKALKTSVELGATHLAFIDDDEFVPQNWLIEHITFYQNNDVLISSGPTYAYFEKAYPAYIKKNNIFKKSSTKKHGQLRNICACGNVFFPLTLVTESGLYFNKDYTKMGGEDGDFFKQASSLGYKIRWNCAAVNYEIVNDERANISWIMHRCFQTGYAGSVLKFNNTNFYKRIFYVFEKTVTVCFDILITAFSLLLGPVIFFNTLGVTLKNAGKLAGALKCKLKPYYNFDLESRCSNDDAS